MLLVASVLSAGLWSAFTYDRANRQQTVVASLIKQGATCHYDFQRIPSSSLGIIYGQSELGFIYQSDASCIELDGLPGPAWIRKWFGLDAVAQVETVRLSGRLEELDLGSLAQLPGLKNLELEDWTDISRAPDAPVKTIRLQALSTLTQLKRLSINAYDVKLDLLFVAALPNLESLSLKGLRLDEAGLEHVGRISRLKVLRLSGDMLTTYGAFRGNDLCHLSGLSELQELDLAINPIDDESLRHLEGLSQLKRLNLSRTEVTDKGMALLLRLKQMESLDLAGTKITDGGLVQLVALTRLDTLDVSETQITDEGIKVLQALPWLRWFSYQSKNTTERSEKYVKQFDLMSLEYNQQRKRGWYKSDEGVFK